MEQNSTSISLPKIEESYVGSVEDICMIFDAILESDPSKKTNQHFYNLRRIAMIIMLCCGLQYRDILNIQNRDILESRVIVNHNKIEVPYAFQRYIKKYKASLDLLSYQSNYLCENSNRDRVTSPSRLRMLLKNGTRAMNFCIKEDFRCPVKKISILGLVRSYCFCRVFVAINERPIQDFMSLFKEHCSSSYAFYEDVELNINNIYELYNKWLAFFHPQDKEQKVVLDFSSRATTPKEAFLENTGSFKLVALDRKLGGMFAKFDEISVLYYELGSENSLTSDINYISSLQNILKLLYLQTPFDDMNLSLQHSNGELVITLSFSSFVLNKKEIGLFLSLAELCEISIYNNQNNIIVSCLVRVSEGSQAKQETNKNIISSVNNNSSIIENNELDADCVCSQGRENKILVLCEVMKIKSEDIFILSNTKKKIFDIYFTQLTDEAQLPLLEAVLVSDLFELKPTLDSRWCCHFEINI